MIALPACRYLMFQGEPFDEADYCAAVDHVQHAMETYDPSLHGFAWDDSNPRLQLEPSARADISSALRAVRTHCNYKKYGPHGEVRTFIALAATQSYRSVPVPAVRSAPMRPL